MSLPFKRVISLFAAPALAGLLAFTVNAAELKEIRIAVPDLSAGTQHSGGGVVDEPPSRPPATAGSTG